MGLLGCQLVLDEPVHPVQRNPPVVADNPSSAVGVRQASDNARMPGTLHIVGINVKYPVVVGLPVLEHVFNIRGQLPAVGLQGVAHHTDAAKGHDGTLQGCVCLESHNGFQFLVDVAALVGGDGGNGVLVNVQHAPRLPFLLQQGQHLVPQRLCTGCGGRKKAVVPVIGGIVSDDKIPQVDFSVPDAAFEIHGFLLVP